MLKVSSSVFIIFSLIFVTGCKKTEKDLLQEIAGKVLDQKRSIENSATCLGDKCLFLAIWDFDGTIIKGDVSNGLIENHKQVFAGLTETVINASLSKKYRAGTYQQFASEKNKIKQKDYEQGLLITSGALAGISEIRLADLAKNHYQQVLQNFYFSFSKQMLAAFKENQVRSIVLSASPDVYVNASHHTLPINLEDIHGIEVEIVEGIITDKVIRPVTYARGKKEKLQNLVAQIEADTGKKVFILAGFGNSYGTDGAFLEFIAGLPHKPATVMINGGESPANYQGKFQKIQLKKTVR